MSSRLFAQFGSGYINRHAVGEIHIEKYGKGICREWSKVVITWKKPEVSSGILFWFRPDYRKLCVTYKCKEDAEAAVKEIIKD